MVYSCCTASERGVTLIQMAILLVLVSLMMVPFFQFQKIVAKQEERTEVKAGVDSIAQALVEYARSNGHYPAPANPTLPLTDLNAGLEQSPTNVLTTNCFNNAAAFVIDGPTNSNTQLTCIKTPTRSSYGTVAPEMYNARILIGAVPFTELGLKPDQALDEYGNKFLYAVTYGLTKPDTFADDKGSIRLVTQRQIVPGTNFTGKNYTSAKGTLMGTAPETAFDQSRVHFVVISHGPNRLGAIGANGALVTCDNGSATPKTCALQDTGANKVQLERVNFFSKANGAIIDGNFRLLVNEDGPGTPPDPPFNSTITRRFIQPGIIQVNNPTSRVLIGPIDAFDDTVAFVTTIMSDSYWTPFKRRGTEQNAYLGVGEGAAAVGIGGPPAGTDPVALGRVHIITDDSGDSENITADEVHTPLICNQKTGAVTARDKQNCLDISRLTTSDPMVNARLPLSEVSAVGLNDGAENEDDYRPKYTRPQDAEHVILDVGEPTVPGGDCLNGASGIDASGDFICIP